MNQILVIVPYRPERSDTRVFYDEPRGLSQEPFVVGVPEMIDDRVREAGIEGAERGFRLLFSPGYFPGHQRRLAWLREDGGGNWYRDEKAGMEGWLCPALFRYFEA